MVLIPIADLSSVRDFPFWLPKDIFLRFPPILQKTASVAFMIFPKSHVIGVRYMRTHDPCSFKATLMYDCNTLEVNTYNSLQKGATASNYPQLYHRMTTSSVQCMGTAKAWSSIGCKQVVMVMCQWGINSDHTALKCSHSPAFGTTSGIPK